MNRQTLYKSPGLLVFLFICLMIGGCGQKGGLYLPERESRTDVNQ